ncbi:FtsX-like permease family protein [Senegalia sp. (in: firmicutes)]|uniref:ABC transporter permease n=1 Tax=Senegalia sp. (in: firmicutes) TaxID=1924098 RepID=UPI003F960951
MITSYKGITKKYLKENKKRAILTIVGIILSVSLISSIGLFFKSMQEAQIEDTKNSFGSAHLQYSNPDEDLIEKIKNNPKVSRSGLYSIGEAFKVDDKINVIETIGTGEALELLPVKVEKGSFPNEKGEVAIQKWLLRYIEPGADIGGMININNKEYRLVGILEDNVLNQMNGEGNIYTVGDGENIDETILLVEIDEKVNLRKTVEELSSLVDEEDIIKNNFLLSLQGAGDTNELFGLYLVVGVIIGIVIISTIAVIYNSFQISVLERMKEFGLLRAVGTTPKQIRKIVLREATLLSIIGIPVGLLFGVLAIYAIDIAFKTIMGEVDLQFIKLTISPLILIGSAVLGIASIYISALLPAVFAGRVSPLLAISNRKSIKKEKINRKRGFLSIVFKSILGFEGELAYKNIKRNKKRYRITVFSIVISVVLFLTFSSFVDMATGVTDSPTESDNIHFSIGRDTNGFNTEEFIKKEMIEEIKDMPVTKKLYGVYNFYDFNMEINSDSKIKKVEELGGQEIYKDSSENGKTDIQGSINIYDKSALEVSKKYLESGNIDIDEMNNKNGVILIERNTVYNYETENSYYGPIADIKVGDKINLNDLIYYEEVEEQGFEEKTREIDKEVEVIAIVKEDVFYFRSSVQGLKLITSEAVAKNLLNEEMIEPINLNIILDQVENEDVAINELERIIKDEPSLNIINHIDMNRQAKSAKLMIQILLYGFVIVVSLIGSVNIINTITTNILLRKREFATLRSIGLTQKSLKKMVVIEGMLYGVMGLIYGSIVGSLLSYVMYYGIGGIREMDSWMIPFNMILIATVAVILIGILSVQYPLAKIKKDNLIETIKGDY